MTKKKFFCYSVSLSHTHNHILIFKYPLWYFLSCNSESKYYCSVVSLIKEKNFKKMRAKILYGRRAKEVVEENKRKLVQSNRVYTQWAQPSHHGSNKNTDTEHCYGQILMKYHFSLLLFPVKTEEHNGSVVKTFLDKEIFVLTLLHFLRFQYTGMHG